MVPTAYYYRGGGFSDVFETTPEGRRVAIIGLGAGVLSAHMGEKDALTFFEIDPDNYEIAKRWFTFLDHCKGEVKVVIGDGRLSMRDFMRDESKFDLITLDAFTGDGIPIHLLTREAFEIYLSRLAEDGIILLHISNRYYDLRPVIKSTIGTLKLFGAANRIVEKDKLEKYQNAANWVSVARSKMRLQALMDKGWVMMGEEDGLSKVKPWTDDHMSIVVPLIEMMKRNFSKFVRG
jgi:spermidine synthase